MGILTKYISKLSMSPILIGLAGFVIFVSVEVLYQLSDLIVRHRVSVIVLLRVLYYYLPYFIALGIPVGVLLAIFWVLSQLSTDHELMALQVHGISLKVLIVPFLAISIVLSFLTFWLSDRVVPDYNQRANEALSKYVYKRPEVFISENILTKIDESQYFYVKKYDRQNGILENVVLFRNEPSEEEIITAQKVLKESEKWYMYDGRLYRVDKEGMLRFDVKFNKVELDLKQDLESIMRVGKTPKDMKSEELRDRIATFKKLGIDPSPWIVELHNRYSVSLGPMIIVLVGIPLSLMFNLKSKSWGVILTFVIIVLYQGSGAWLGAMGKERLIDPVLSAWLPNILFGITGTVLFILLDTPISYRLREKFSKLFIIMLLLTFANTVHGEVLTVNASSVTYDATSVIFSGNIAATFQDSRIECQKLTVFLSKSGDAQKIIAEESVSYAKKDTTIKCQQFTYTFSDEHSLMANIRGRTIYTDEEKNKHTVYFSGKNLEGKNDESLIEKGYLTTCELDRPHYRMQALKVEIKENEYLAAYDAVIFILEIPTVYLPVYFVSLKEGPQPFAVKLGYSKSDGFSFESSYNVSFKDGSVGAKIGWQESSDTPGKYAQFDLTKEWSIFKLQSSYYVRQPPQEQDFVYEFDSSLYINEPISTKLRAFFKNDRSYFEYQLLPIKELSIQLSRLQNSSGVTWVLPYIYLKKITLPSDLFTFTINSLYHRSTVQYTEGSLFDHLEEFDMTGRFSTALSVKLPSVFKNLQVDFSGYYDLIDFEPTERTYFLLDSKLPFKTIRANFGFLGWTVDNSLLTGIWMGVDNEQLGYRFAQLFDTKLTFKPFDFLSLSAGYSRTGVITNNVYSGFSNDSEVSEITFLGKLNVPTTLFEVSTAYDLLTSTWDDLNLKTSTAFKIWQIGFSIYTNTIYQIEEGQFYKTDFDIDLSYGSLRHVTEFTYYYNKEDAIDMITNTLTVKGTNFLFMNNPNVKIIYKLDTHFDLLSIEAKGSFYVDKAKHEFSGYYIKGSSRLRFSYNLSGFDPAIGFYISMNTQTFAINDLQFTLEKDLHCWGLVFESQFSIDPTFSIEKLAFKFYIKEFPKKTFTVDPVTGAFDMNVF
ncbi:YjgP/YjgQ family permease [Thermotoga profunda]|uniref:YjgP/YjgQ family permease n=1 Tax=Thermotoga profunda TaxID=1508420 RepID=UPI000597D788|nr:YjgP/YjgQ family permease [Thermotoga profunda]